jgi:hypothetical protein
MLAAEVTVAGLLASSGGGLSQGRAAALLAMFCIFAAAFAWSWVRLQPHGLCTSRIVNRQSACRVLATSVSTLCIRFVAHRAMQLHSPVSAH